MFTNYLPIIVILDLSFLIGLIAISAGFLLGPKKPSTLKNDQYECGFPASHPGQRQFDIKFYLVAIMFIVFDLEVAFIFPWALIIREMSGIAFYAMIIFLTFLIIGLVYEWSKGALEWE